MQTKRYLIVLLALIFIFTNLITVILTTDTAKALLRGWVDSTTIESETGAVYKLVPSGDSNYDWARNEASSKGNYSASLVYAAQIDTYEGVEVKNSWCVPTIVIASTGGASSDPDPANALIVLPTTRSVFGADGDRCNVERSERIALTNPSVFSATDAAEAGSTSGADDTTDDLVQGCAFQIGVLGWLFCLVIDAADGIYNFVKGRIAALLITNTDELDGLRASWTAVRNIANSLLVLVALAMIASQIFNFDFLSAYTIKKVLPRLLIAAIAIQLSWQLAILGIEFVNALGSGLYNLLLWPFVTAGGGSGDITSLWSSSGGATTGATLLGIFAGGFGGAAAAISAMQLGGGLALVITLLGVLMSILVAFFVILIRGVLILILVALVPIALAAWILPGTQNLWKAWWELFSKLLLMFPLIMLLFAGGTIGANLIQQANEGKTGLDAVFAIIMMLVVYFAPLFLIVATFKFAGRIFGTVINGVNKINDVGKKTGYGLGKKRDAYKEIANKAQAEERQKAVRERAARMYGGRVGRPGFRERATQGVEGFIPGGKEKVQRQRARYADVAEQERMKDAQNMYSGILANTGADKDFALRSGLGIPGTEAESDKGYSKGIHAQILRSQFGEDVAITDSKGNVRARVKSTPELHAAALTDAIENKNIQIVDEYRQASTSDDTRRDVLGKVSQTAFGKLDTIAPDQARGGSWDTGPNPGQGRIQQMLGTSSAAADYISTNVSTPQQVREREIYSTWNDGLKQIGTLKGKRKQAIIGLLDETLSNGQQRMAQATTQEERNAVLSGIREAVANAEGLASSEGVRDDPESNALVRQMLGGQVGRVMSSGGNERLQVNPDGSVSVVSTFGSGGPGSSGGSGPSGGTGPTTRTSGPGYGTRRAGP